MPVEVQEISVYPDVTGTQLAIWFEKDQSFRLLWSLDLDLAEDFLSMLQAGIRHARLETRAQ